MSRGDCEPSTRTLEAWATRLPANEALLKMHEYEDLFRRCYRSRAVNFNVVGIQEVPDLSPAALNAGRIQVIEESVAALRARMEGGR